MMPALLARLLKVAAGGGALPGNYGFGFSAIAAGLRGKKKRMMRHASPARPAGMGFFRLSDRTTYQATPKGWIRLGIAGPDGSIIPGS